MKFRVEFAPGDWEGQTEDLPYRLYRIGRFGTRRLLASCNSLETALELARQKTGTDGNFSVDPGGNVVWE